LEGINLLTTVQGLILGEHSYVAYDCEIQIDTRLQFRE
jgi:predicted hotdog family 3-hydroxylacyl-ACP dehydratase